MPLTNPHYTAKARSLYQKKTQDEASKKASARLEGGDVGRCGEMRGDAGRCGEMCLEGGGASRVRARGAVHEGLCTRGCARGARQWMESLGACREMWGHAHAQHTHTTCGEIWGGLNEVVESLGAGRAQGGSGA